MNESQALERVVLKILNGVQAGAEVSLTPGEYTVGSGDEDDIQFIDVSLKPAQAKLRIAAGKIEIAGVSGGVTVGADLKIGAGSEWQDVEPLDIITAGMIRFVLGPPNANWTTLVEQDSRPADEKKLGKDASLAGIMRSKLNPAYIRLVLPLVVLIGLVLAVVSLFPFGGKEKPAPQIAQADAEGAARTALDQFPFGRQVALKREVDGTIYATGFVKDGFERRALVAAVEKSGAQVYFRLGVLEALRIEIDGLIKSEKVAVTYTLSPAGELVLEGVILDESAAQQFVERIRGSVAGLTRVESKIRTAKVLLDEVQKLTRTAQIDQLVLLRLDGVVIEATGILTIDKIDSWVGFLTSYSRRFGKEIGLRSFVQLQKPDGSLVSPPGQPVVIGGQADGDKALDRDKLLQGRYKTDDLFAGSAGSATPSATTGAQTKVSPFVQGELTPSREAMDVESLAVRANELLTSWRTSQAVGNDLDFLAEQRAAVQRLKGGAGSGDGSDKYLPLLQTSLREPANTCRPGSRLTTENLPTAIFWLDLLSISDKYSLATFSLEDQGFLLEAALEPKLASECLARSGAEISSLYLNEAPRNPDFVRYLLRDYRPFSLEVSGASVSGSRYVQTRDGDKLVEGGAPDGASRLAVVGELGSIIRQKTGYLTVIYPRRLNWLSEK